MLIYPKIKIKNRISGLFIERLELVFAFLISCLFINYFPFIDKLIITEQLKIIVISLFPVIFSLSYFLKKVKDNLKLILEYLYGTVFILIVFIAFQNGFNEESYFSFLIIYAYLSVAFRNVDSYLTVNILLCLFFLMEYLLFPFELEISRFLIIGSYIVVFFVGYFIIQVRIIIRKKLDDKQNFLDYLFNSSTQGLLLVNKKDKLIYDLNKKALNILQIKLKDFVINKNINEIEICNEFIFKELSGNNLKTIELKDKRVLKIKIENIIYKKKEYYFISIEDYKNYIDLNKTIEFTTLKKISEESYNYLFEESSSMLSIYDKENRFIDLNNTFANILGYKKEELIGCKGSIISGFSINNEEEIINNLWNGIPQSYEKTIKTKNGDVINIEVLSRKGMFLGNEVIISNGRSIEERKKLEKEVSVNYERYKKVTDESPIGFVVTDMEGCILECNKSFQELLGYTKEEIELLDIFKITKSEDILKSIEIRSRLENGEINKGEIEKRFIRKDGSFLSGLLKIILQKDIKGNPKYYISQIVDITVIKEVQEELEISEKNYKDLFNNSDELLYILNDKNEFIDINKSVIFKYGYSKEEIIGKTPDLFSAPDMNDLNEIIKNINKVWDGEKYTTLWWAKTKGGKIFPKNLTIRLGFYRGEKALVASAMDISESYEFDRILKEKEQNYRDLFERNLAGVYRTAENGDILECNQAFLEILGYNKLDYEKNKINSYTFHFTAEGRNNLAEKIKEKKYIKGEKHILKTKSNKPITVLLNASVIANKDGLFKYFEGSLIDISEQEENQKKLKSSEQEYIDLINSSPFGIIITRKMKVLFANQKSAEILNYDNKEELLEKKSYDILLKEDKPVFDGQLEQLKMDKVIPFSNYSVKKKDGFLVNVECKPSLIKYEGKRCVLLAFINSSDKEKIKEVSEKIKETEKFNLILQSQLKEKEVLLKEVHHRVKNNMQVISSILNLQSSYSDDESLKAIIKDSQNRINSMALIHEKLYNTIDFSNINFSNYITDLSNSLINSYESISTKVNIRFDLEEVFLSLNNSIPLGLIFNELISNTLKYAFVNKEEGLIKIELKIKKEEIFIKFCDNGIGIPKEIEFMNTKTLGLQLVNTLIEQLRGDIELNNSNGACFSIKFNRFE